MKKLTGRKFIPVEEAFKAWEKEPAFREAYERLHDEFEKAAALIDASPAPDCSEPHLGPAKKLA